MLQGLATERANWPAQAADALTGMQLYLDNYCTSVCGASAQAERGVCSRRARENGQEKDPEQIVVLNIFQPLSSP